MIKKCNLCGSVHKDVREGERFCSVCRNGELTDYVEPEIQQSTPRPAAGLSGGYNVDNRIHEGDYIGQVHNGAETHIAGDHTENINNSTNVTTNHNNNTSNTTIYNITQVIHRDRVADAHTIPPGVGSTTVPPVIPIVQTPTATESAPVIPAIPVIPAVKPREPRWQTPRPAETRPTTVISDRTDSPSWFRQNARWIYLGLGVVLVMVITGLLFMNGGKADPEPAVAQQTAVTEDLPLGRQDNGYAQSPPRYSATKTVSLPATSPDESSQEATVVSIEVSNPYKDGENAYNSGDYATARLSFQEAVDNGNNRACYYLAMIYLNGYGVSADIIKAFEYMKRGAEAGEARAYFPLAEMYRNGDGTEANRNLAKKWYEKTVVADKRNSQKASEILELYE